MNRFSLPAIAVAGAILGGLAVWGFDRQGGGVERAQVEAIVHDYVLAHPEILPEAMEKLRDRESGKTVTANRAAIVTPFGSAWAGNPKGDVTLVEYFDYNCGYCRASLPMIAKLIAADPKVRVVFRELPILSAESRIAAGYVSLVDWPIFTWSLGCTRSAPLWPVKISLARLAMTSFTFMWVDVPAPI